MDGEKLASNTSHRRGRLL